MKRTILLPALALAILVTGCKPKAGTDENSNNSSNSNLSEIVKTAAKTVYGEVYKTVGNQLTIKVLDGEFDPKKVAEQQNGTSRPSNGSMSFGTGADGKVSVPENVRWGGGGTGTPSEFSRPPAETDASGNRVTRQPAETDASGNRVTRQPAETDASGNRVTRQPAETDASGNRVTRPAPTDENGKPLNVPSRTGGKTYTGEELDIVIPIGTPVTTYVFKDGTYTEKDSDIADIKGGTTVYIEYEDGENVSKVHIVPVSSRSSREIGGVGNGNIDPANLPPEIQAQIADARAGGLPVLVQNDGNGNVVVERVENVQSPGDGRGG
jgi:hypothetical protein